MTTASISIPLRLTRQAGAGLLAVGVAVIVLLIYGQIQPSLAIFWLFGLGFGFVVQRSRFCFTSAFRDLFLLQDGRLAKGVLVALATATVGFALIMYNLSPDMTKIVGNVYPTGWHTVLGGLLFGTGMVVAGGCASGTLYRMGEGYVAQWVALMGMLIGSFLLALQWEWWWPRIVSPQPKIWFPQTFGWGGAATLTLVVLGILYLLVLWWESRAGGIFQWRGEPPPTETFGQHLSQLYNTIFVRAWPAVLGGLLLGLLNILEFTYKKPWGITTEISRWAGWMWDDPIKGAEARRGSPPKSAAGLAGWPTVWVIQLRICFTLVINRQARNC